MDRFREFDLEFLRRVQTLFERLLDVPPAEREALLQAECRDEAALEAEVSQLLHAATRSENFLEALNESHVAAMLRSGGDSIEPGTRIGPYAIVRELGRGGMGVVYLARREDGSFQQQVALKLLKRGMDSEAILASFLRERQILAWLQHEHIARLYDGGLSDDGRPWFAMEYVDGLPLTQYCDQHKLSVPRRIELFRSGCTAVQYAHQNLVIHRDLKPSNVLVTADGQLKLLDFGIAKLLGAGEQGATLTFAGARAMTPEYAAPEQLRGEAVTTATDLYALGVLLYELLTGRRPHPSAVPLAQRVSDVQTTRPSRAVLQRIEGSASDADSVHRTSDELSEARATRPQQLQRLLAGDLDTIILKAMHPDPARRYASADALGEDLRRHLDGLPVLAQSDRWTYRAAKFMRRNRWPVAAAAAVTVLLIAFGIVTLVQKERTARERDRAEAVKDFVVSLFESANPLKRGQSETELLTLGAERIATEFAHEPLVQAELYLAIGTAQLERGDYGNARTLLQRALDLRSEHFGRQSLEVADVLNQLASLERRTQNYAIAEPLYREVLAIRKQQLGERNLEVASAINDLGTLLYSLADYPAAEALYRESLDIKREQLGEEHEEIAISLGNLAMLLRDRGDLLAAEATMRQALEMKRRVFGSEHPSVASSVGGLATILTRLGKYEEAAIYYDAAYANRLANLGETHPSTLTALQNAAYNERNMGALEQARARYQELLRLLETVTPPDGDFLASTLGDLARTEYVLGNIEAAEQSFRRAGEVGATLDSAGTVYRGIAASGRGAVLLARGRHTEALAPLRDSMALHSNASANERRHAMWAQCYLGACLSLTGEVAAADSLLSISYEGLRDNPRFAFEARQAREQLLAHLLRHGREAEAARLR